MLVCEYILNGLPVSQQDYSSEDLEGNQPYVLADSVPAGYQDITSIESLNNHGFRLGKDYKYVRREIKSIVASIGFEGLTVEEKKISSTHFCVSKEERLMVHTIEEQIENGVRFHERSIASRKKRRLIVEVEVYSRLESNKRKKLLKEMYELLELYEKFGVEGTLEGDDEGLFDYIEERPATSFFGNGLKSKNYTIDGFSNINDFAIHLMQILKGET